MNTSALALGGIAAAAIMFHLAFLSDRALIPLFLVAGLLGATFVSFGYGFTERLRALVSGGAGRALGTAFIIPAIAAPIVLPVGALVEGYARFVAPVGLPLLLGAAVFGIGMQIANGCGSGCLVAAGQGSRRLLVALPFFCAGGVLGSLVLPALLRLPDLGEIDLADRLGVGPGLLATEALLAAGAALLLRGSRPLRADLLAGSVIGALAIVVFLVSGQPWGITTGLTLFGAKAAQGVGIDLTGSTYWSPPGARDLLARPALGQPSALTDVGMLMGAFLAAAATGKLRFGTAIGTRAVLGAAIGGMMMGIGARLSFGCNIGAFVSGAASGSLHGFVWIIAVLPGCWLGARLRPVLGLPA